MCKKQLVQEKLQCSRRGEHGGVRQRLGERSKSCFTEGLKWSCPEKKLIYTVWSEDYNNLHRRIVRGDIRKLGARAVPVRGQPERQHHRRIYGLQHHGPCPAHFRFQLGPW